MAGSKRQRWTSLILVNGMLLILVLLWTVPTMGLFISSWRYRFDIQTSGWWTVLPHREWEVVATLDPKELDLDPDTVMVVEGAEADFATLREGVETPGGKRVQWVGNKRLGRIEVQEQVWTANWNFTTENYSQVLQGKDFEYQRPDGTV